MIAALPRFLLLLLCSFSTYAGETVLSSGDDQALLMELYTSEGCSSCPPMENYLNRFKSHESLWKHFIPVAFHVDYWNYIGWVDRYASREFAKRQRRHASEGNVRSVYTPALIVNGSSWRPGAIAQLPTPKTSAAGKLEVRVNQNELIADFRPNTDNTQTLDLHIALLGMGLTSKITAGENKGRISLHEFVVVGFDTVRGANGHWQTRLPEPHYQGMLPRALAVWITPVDSLKPLQAVGGYLD